MQGYYSTALFLDLSKAFVSIRRETLKKRYQGISNGLLVTRLEEYNIHVSRPGLHCLIFW